MRVAEGPADEGGARHHGGGERDPDQPPHHGPARHEPLAGGTETDRRGTGFHWHLLFRTSGSPRAGHAMSSAAPGAVVRSGVTSPASGSATSGSPNRSPTGPVRGGFTDAPGVAVRTSDPAVVRPT